jgi:DNA-directed RNA polymerase I, II, and III subunit RPABC2
MSYNSDLENSDPESYASSEEEEEEEEEEIVEKKQAKLPIAAGFGNTVKYQNRIGGGGGEGSDDDIEDMEEEDDDDDPDGLGKSSTKKSKKGNGKGKKKRSKNTEDDEEEFEDQDMYAGGEGEDSDIEDNAESEAEDVNDSEYDSDEETSAEEPEKYMHHFDKEITKEYILETHPECIPVNMEEVRALSRVVRNKDGIIIDDFHKTIPVVTKYEKARIIGQRAMQLNSGAQPYIDAGILIDGASIAEREFEEKKIPVIIKRPLPNGAFEYWRLKDLEILY